MTYDSLSAFLRDGATHLAKGPVALIFIEDEIEIETTLRHHAALGFKKIIALMPAAFALSEEMAETVVRITTDRPTGQPMIDAINKIIDAAPGLWLYYCFNGEYLFYPFCENRTVGEMTTFQLEERRFAMLSYVVDLYASDLTTHPNAVSLDDAMLDKSGYYALARTDPENHDHPKERQLDFFGGLRWRYEEHIPTERRKIDRIALFQAKPGLKLRPDLPSMTRK